ncbi:MAG: hypothetical protein ACUVX8_09640 [Candidatus Zipacnadales bacterium]
MRSASSLAMVVVVLVLLLVAAGAMKLYADRQSMTDMIDNYGQTLASLPIGSPEAMAAFRKAAEAAKAGRYEEAESELKRGGEAAKQGAGGGEFSIPGILPGFPMGEVGGGGDIPTFSEEEVEHALQALPEKARPFFAKRRGLFRRALALSAAAKTKDPKAWEAYRARILEAAAEGDQDAVRALIQEAGQALGVPTMVGPEFGPRGTKAPGSGGMLGGPRPGGRAGSDMFAGASADQLRQAIASARAMLPQLQQMGINPKEAMEVLNRAEKELGSGNTQGAARVLREAMAAVRGMVQPGIQPPSRPGREGMRGFAGREPGGGPGQRGSMMGPWSGRGREAGRELSGRPGMGGFPWMPWGQAPSGAGESGMGGILPGVFGSLLSQMQKDSGVLRSVMDDLDNASLALLEKNQDQIREILSGARKKIASLSANRGEWEQRLAAAQPDRPQGIAPPRGQTAPPQGRGPGRWGQGQGRGPENMGPSMSWELPTGFDLQRVHDLLGRAFDEARQMSDEEYEAFRADLINRLMMSFLGSPSEEWMVPPDQPDQPAAVEDLPLIPVPKQEPTETEARERLELKIRNRLRAIHAPYVALDEANVDLTEVNRTISAARAALGEGNLSEATKSTNEATELLWKLVNQHRPDLLPIMQEALRGEEARMPSGSDQGVVVPNLPGT